MKAIQRQSIGKQLKSIEVKIKGLPLIFRGF
ncbi:MAG: hypothetical protein RL629_1313 [Pseudomonadota bacterium]